MRFRRRERCRFHPYSPELVEAIADQIVEEMRAARAAGLTDAEIADRFGLDDDDVRALLDHDDAERRFEP